MTEPRPADPVDPGRLFEAFMIVNEHNPPDETEPQKLSEDDTNELWDRIRQALDTEPHETSDLFRRACALANFFSGETMRARFGVTEGKPPWEIWVAAANARVVQLPIGELVRDTFDADEFAEALRKAGS